MILYFFLSKIDVSLVLLTCERWNLLKTDTGRLIIIVIANSNN